MTNQQNIENNSLVKISPSKRVFAFRDLPPEVQGNLLRLQNSDGDFLRIRYVSAYTSGGLLILLSIAFILFLAAIIEFLDNFENVVFDLKWIIVFSVGACVFALCYLFLFWIFFRGRRSPLKKGIYLTPTQVIETFDGIVRYRELKDTGEISVDKFQGGWQTSLVIKFPDGDFYKYYLFMNDYGALPAKLLAEGEKWREKVELWKNEAISAAQRGDTAYFKLHDGFSKSATANLPVLNKYFSPRLLMSLIFIITMALILFDTIIFYGVKLSEQ